MEKEIKFYPGSILMILGYKCTNSCSYCYLKKNGAKMEQNMSLETFEKAIKWYENFLETPNLPYKPSIALIGGEPLMYWDELNFEKNLPILAKIVKKHGKEIRLVSNGILLDDNKRKIIKENNIAVDISLDGPKETHDKNRKTKDGKGTWDQAFKVIQNLIQDGNDLRVRGTITKNNASHAFEMYKFLSDLDCKRIGLEIDTFNNWTDKELSLLSIEYDKILEHYISNYDKEKSCFSLDRVLKLLPTDLIASTKMDSKFLRPNSMAILPDGELKINHNFPVWADLETAKLFSIGTVENGLNEEIIEQYLNHFGLMTESAYYAYNDEKVCKNCPASGIMCQTPYNNSFLPRSVWLPNHTIQCYALRFISVFGVKYLKKYGYYK
jgi:sulfatase maturation enzyme AslB (radical SAM superfamily)